VGFYGLVGNEDKPGIWIGAPDAGVGMEKNGFVSRPG
jgi:hypothetical protein